MKFQAENPGDFAAKQSIDLSTTTQENILGNYQGANKQAWKNLIPFTTREGVIYSDAQIEVTISTQTMQFLVRLLLTFKSKNGLPVTNLVG